jgi:hypothetical protein
MVTLHGPPRDYQRNRSPGKNPTQSYSTKWICKNPELTYIQKDTITKIAHISPQTAQRKYDRNLQIFP